jgi:hypothetical protein
VGHSGLCDHSSGLGRVANRRQFVALWRACSSALAPPANHQKHAGAASAGARTASVVGATGDSVHADVVYVPGVWYRGCDAVQRKLAVSLPVSVCV